MKSGGQRAAITHKEYAQIPDSAMLQKLSLQNVRRRYIISVITVISPVFSCIKCMP